MANRRVPGRGRGLLTGDRNSNGSETPLPTDFLRRRYLDDCEIGFHNLRFFRNADGDIRILKSYTHDFHLVIKLMHASDVSTFELWTGDIEHTIIFWTTKEFSPDPSEKHDLTRRFLSCLHEYELKFFIYVLGR